MLQNNKNPIKKHYLPIL